MNPQRGKRRVRVAVFAVLAGVVLALVFVVVPSIGSPMLTPEREIFAAPPPEPAVAVSASTPGGSPTSTPGGPLVGGWYAGASGLGVANGTFQSWLGQQVTIAATWADQSESAQRSLSTLGVEYRNWKRAMDLAVGGTVLGSRENYAAAARGAYDKRWRAAARALAVHRKSATGPTFVRPFHEMNGDWYVNWAVTKANSADYKRAFARYVGILRAAMPTVYISWSPNYRDHSGLPIQAWYPGDAVVDCVAPDYYDDSASRARVDVKAWNAQAGERDARGNPQGLETWRQFALHHGKPVCFPEWGLKPTGGGTDHPVWIRAVNAWMNQHANTVTWHLGQPIPAAAAGKVLYSVYFNVVHEGRIGFTIYGTGANPRSAAVFRRLTWGRPGIPS